MEKLNIKLRVAAVQATDLFRNALRDSRAFNQVIEGISGSIADAFRELPSTVTTKFTNVKDLEEEILGVQQQIIDSQAQLDPMSNDYKRSVQEINRLKDKQSELEDQLKNAKSLVTQIGVGFAELAASAGEIVLDVQADLLKEALSNVFSDVFSGEEQSRRKAIISSYQEAFRLTNPELTAAIAKGHAIGLSGLSLGEVDQAIRVATTGAPRKPVKPTDQITGFRLVGPPTIDQQLQLEAANAQTDSAGELSKGASDLEIASKALLQFAATGIGTGLGGGGKGAASGAAIGGLLGLIPGIGMALGPIGSLFGGLIGGSFDKQTKLPELLPAVRDNTSATNKNTQALQDLRSEFINAPARFVIPATASIGGRIPNIGTTTGFSFNDSTPSGLEPIQVQINFNGPIDSSQRVAEIKNSTLEALREGYSEQGRRLGRRVSR